MKTLACINIPYPDLAVHRDSLRSLYAGQFDRVVFTAPEGVEPDADTVLVPTPLDIPHRRCGCAHQPPHPSDLHHKQYALLALDRSGIEFDAGVFIEDDVILGPRFDGAELARRLDGSDLLMCADWPMDFSGTWFPTFFLGSGYQTLLQIVGPGVFRGAFLDFLGFSRDGLRRLAPWLEATAVAWHELGIPTAVARSGLRVGRADGVALWDADRDQSLEALLSLATDRDFVHPVKWGKWGKRILDSCPTRADAPTQR